MVEFERAGGRVCLVGVFRLDSSDPSLKDSVQPKIFILRAASLNLS